MGFDFIMIVPLLLSYCGFFFVFGCRISFVVGSSIFFFDGCSPVSCDFGIFVRRGELMSFYSAILSLACSKEPIYKFLILHCTVNTENIMFVQSERGRTLK